ncbi:MAG: YdcF family protein [Halanaerobiales bacterium]
MIAIQKVISAFLTLPGLYLTLTLILSIYIINRSKSKFIKFIAVFTSFLMLVTFTGLGVKLLLYPLEKNVESFRINRDNLNSYPIVVLGGGINHDTGSGEGTLSSSSLERIVTAYKIYREIDSVIVFSGGIGVGRHRTAEADLISDWLKELEVAEEDIILEDKARTTYENGKYVKEWLNTVKYEKIYLVTSAVHMQRAGAVFRNQDIEFIPVPAGYTYSHTLAWLDYLPNRGALRANMSAVHEWAGILWYIIAGYV